MQEVWAVLSAISHGGMTPEEQRDYCVDEEIAPDRIVDGIDGLRAGKDSGHPFVPRAGATVHIFTPLVFGRRCLDAGKLFEDMTEAGLTFYLAWEGVGTLPARTTALQEQHKLATGRSQTEAATEAARKVNTGRKRHYPDLLERLEKKRPGSEREFKDMWQDTCLSVASVVESMKRAGKSAGLAPIAKLNASTAYRWARVRKIPGRADEPAQKGKR